MPINLASIAARQVERKREGAIANTTIWTYGDLGRCLADIDALLQEVERLKPYEGNDYVGALQSELARLREQIAEMKGASQCR